MDERRIVAKRIEALRTSRGMTQPEFAAALGMQGKRGRSMVNNWEQGAVQVKSDDLTRISKTFGVSADWLLGLAEEPSYSADVQTVSNMTGLSEPFLKLLHIDPEVSEVLNTLAKPKENKFDSCLFRLVQAILRLKRESNKAAVFVLSEDQNKRFEDASSKKDDLELALFHFSEVCRSIPEEYLSRDILKLLDSQCFELYGEELRKFFSEQEAKRND